MFPHPCKPGEEIDHVSPLKMHPGALAAARGCGQARPAALQLCSMVDFVAFKVFSKASHTGLYSDRRICVLLNKKRDDGVVFLHATKPTNPKHHKQKRPNKTHPTDPSEETRTRKPSLVLGPAPGPRHRVKEEAPRTPTHLRNYF